MLDRSLLSGFRREGEFLHPDYARYGLACVPAAVRALLGGPHVPLRALWPGGPARRVVLVLADGFGFAAWEKYFERLPFLRRVTERGVVCPITSVFPSTTAAAITTIHSGLAPAQHALLEWFVYFDEIDAVLETLPFAPVTGPLEPTLEPKILFSKETIYGEFERAGIRCYHVMPESYAFSPYTKRVTEGATVLGCASLAEQCATARSLLGRVEGQCYVYLHWGGIDGAAHRYGPDSRAHVDAMTVLSEVLARELAWGGEDAVLVITADHGMVPVDPERTIYLNQFPQVMGNLARSAQGRPIPPWGNARDVMLRVRPEALAEVKGFLASKLAGKAVILETEEVFRAGLFGPGTPDEVARRRAGNLLILPTGTNTVWFEYAPGHRMSLVGLHGGLTPEEMLVPFAVARLSDLRA